MRPLRTIILETIHPEEALHQAFHDALTANGFRNDVAYGSRYHFVPSDDGHAPISSTVQLLKDYGYHLINHYGDPTFQGRSQWVNDHSDSFVDMMGNYAKLGHIRHIHSIKYDNNDALNDTKRVLGRGMNEEHEDPAINTMRAAFHADLQKVPRVTIGISDPIGDAHSRVYHVKHADPEEIERTYQEHGFQKYKNGVTDDNVWINHITDSKAMFINDKQTKRPLSIMHIDYANRAIHDETTTNLRLGGHLGENTKPEDALRQAFHDDLTGMFWRTKHYEDQNNHFVDYIKKYTGLKPPEGIDDIHRKLTAHGYVKLPNHRDYYKDGEIWHNPVTFSFVKYHPKYFQEMTVVHYPTDHNYRMVVDAYDPTKRDPDEEYHENADPISVLRGEFFTSLENAGYHHDQPYDEHQRLHLFYPKRTMSYESIHSILTNHGYERKGEIGIVNHTGFHHYRNDITDSEVYVRLKHSADHLNGAVKSLDYYDA